MWVAVINQVDSMDRTFMCRALLKHSKNERFSISTILEDKKNKNTERKLFQKQTKSRSAYEDSDAVYLLELDGHWSEIHSQICMK